MMLRASFGLAREAEWIESAVDRLFSRGIRTADIAEPGATTVGCSKFGERLQAEMAVALGHSERYGQGA
jgi:3-isopropylmalate dehydrogenase